MKSPLILLFVLSTSMIFSQEFIDVDYYPAQSPSASKEQVNNVVATSDGGYLLVGAIKETSNGNWQGRVIKVDANGNETGEGKLIRSNRDVSFYDAVEINGAFFVCGAENYQGTDRPLLTKYAFNSNESISLLSPQYVYVSKFSGFGKAVAHTVTKTYGGNILMGGYYLDGNTRKGFVFAISSNNPAIQSSLRTYGSSIGKLVQSTDGNYYAFGVQDDPTENCSPPPTFAPIDLRNNTPIEVDGGDVLVTKLNQSYNQIWSSRIGGDTGDSFLDGVATPDGGFAILGRTECEANNSSDNSGPDDIALSIEDLFYPHWLYKGVTTGDKDWIRGGFDIGTSTQIFDYVKTPFGLLNSCSPSKLILASNQGGQLGTGVVITRISESSPSENYAAFGIDYDDGPVNTSNVIGGNSITQGLNNDIVIGGNKSIFHNEFTDEDFAFFQFSPETECTVDCSICAEDDPYLPPAYQCDNFDRYETGSDITENSNFWSLWDAESGAGRIISQGADGNRVLSINDNSPADDVLFQLNGADGPDITSGRHRFSWDMFIQPNERGYYNFQFQKNAISQNGNQAFRVVFEEDGSASLTSPENTEGINFTYTPGRILKIANIIDLDENSMELWINYNFIGEIPYNQNSIGAIDFWASSGSDYWIDNICVRTTGSSPVCGDVGPFEIVTLPNAVCTENGRQYSSACDAGNNGLYAQEEYGECASICSFNATFIGRGDDQGYIGELRSTDLAPSSLYNEPCIRDAYDGEVPFPLYANLYIFENTSEQEIIINTFGDTKSFLFKCSFGETTSQECITDDGFQPEGIYYIVILSDKPTTYNLDVAPNSICAISENNLPLSCGKGFNGTISNNATSFLSVSNGAYTDCYGGIRTYNGQEEIFQFEVTEASIVDIAFTTSAGAGGLFLFGANCGEDCLGYIETPNGGGEVSLPGLTLSSGNYYLIVDQEAGRDNEIGEFDISIFCILDENNDGFNFFTQADVIGCNVDESPSGEHTITVNIPDVDNYIPFKDKFAFNRAQGSNLPQLTHPSLLQVFNGESSLVFTIPSDLEALADRCSYQNGDSLQLYIQKNTGLVSTGILQKMTFASTSEANVSAEGAFAKGEKSVLIDFENTTNTIFAQVPTSIYLKRTQDNGKQDYWQIGSPWTATTAENWLEMESLGTTRAKGKQINDKGNAPVIIRSASANNTYEIRRGKIIVETEDGLLKQTLQVSQLGRCEPPILSSLNEAITKICSGENITLNVDAGPGPNSVYNYQWSNGSRNKSITVSPGTTTNYTVTVTQPMEGTCTAASTRTFRVEVTPPIQAPSSNGNKIICESEGGAILSVSSSNNLIVNWYDSAQGGNLLQRNSNSYFTSIPGTYYAELLEPNTGCRSLARTAVNLEVSPRFSLQANVNNPNICLGESLDLFATISGANANNASYKWGKDGATVGINRVLPYQFSTEGSHLITLEVTIGACIVSQDFSINVFSYPSINLQGLNSINCSLNLQSYSVDFFSNGTIVAPKFGELKSLGNQSYQLENIPAGQDLLIQSIDNNCISELKIEAPSCECPAIPPPIVNNGNSLIQVCSDLVNLPLLEATTFNPDHQINWFNSDGTLVQANSRSLQPAQIGTYYAISIDPINNCNSESSNVITIIELPEIKIINNQSIIEVCQGESVLLTPILEMERSSDNFEWYIGSQLIGQGHTYQFTNSNNPGLTTIKLIVRDSASICQAETEYSIMVIKEPKIILTDAPSCSSDLNSYELQVSIDADSFSIDNLSANIEALSQAGSFKINSIPIDDPITIKLFNKKSNGEFCTTQITYQSPVNCNCDAISIPSPTSSNSTISICEGTTIPSLNIDPLPAGFIADWYYQANDLVPFQSGLLTYLPTSATSVYVKTRDLQSGCVNETALKLNLIINPVPEVIMDEDTLVCLGSILTFDPNINGNGPFNYEWSSLNIDINEPSQKEQELKVLQDLTLTLKVTDKNECFTIVQPNVQTIVLPQVNIENIQSLDCVDSANGILLASPISGALPFTYQWSEGLKNQQLINELNAGTYRLTFTDANGCENVDSFSLAAPPAFEIEVRDSFSIMQSGDSISAGIVEVIVKGGTPPYSYTWQNQLEEIISQTSVLESISRGPFKLILADSNGCMATFDDILLNLIVGTNNIVDPISLISIYPNPTTGLTEIIFPDKGLNHTELIIFNIIGNQVRYFELSNTNSGRSTIDLSDLAKGSYWLHFKNKTKTNLLKLIKL